MCLQLLDKMLPEVLLDKKRSTDLKNESSPNCRTEPFFLWVQNSNMHMLIFVPVDTMQQKKAAQRLCGVQQVGQILF